MGRTSLIEMCLGFFLSARWKKWNIKLRCFLALEQVIYVSVPLEITGNGHFQEPCRCNYGDDMVGN